MFSLPGLASSSLQPAFLTRVPSAHGVIYLSLSLPPLSSPSLSHPLSLSLSLGKFLSHLHSPDLLVKGRRLASRHFAPRQDGAGLWQVDKSPGCGSFLRSQVWALTS